MRNPLLKCEYCGGTGKRPMSGDLHETLEAVIHLKSAHSAQVVEALGHNCKQEAMSNRLASFGCIARTVELTPLTFWLNMKPSEQITPETQQTPPASAASTAKGELPKL